MRERVLERDRFRCRACGAKSRLLVHHRDHSNAPKVLVMSRCNCDLRYIRGIERTLRATGRRVQALSPA